MTEIGSFFVDRVTPEWLEREAAGLAGVLAELECHPQTGLPGRSGDAVVAFNEIMGTMAYVNRWFDRAVETAYGLPEDVQGLHADHLKRLKLARLSLAGCSKILTEWATASIDSEAEFFRTAPLSAVTVRRARWLYQLTAQALTDTAAALRPTNPDRTDP